MLNQAKNPGQQRKGQLPRFGELWDHDFTVLLCFFPPDRVEYLHARAINAAALPCNFLFPFHLSSPWTRRTGKHRMRDEVTRKAAERSPQGDRDVTGPGLPLCYPIAQRSRHPTRPRGAQKENGFKVSAEGGETSSGRDPGCSAGAPLGAAGGSAGPPRGVHTPLSPVCPPVLSNPYPVSSPPHSILFFSDIPKGKTLPLKMVHFKSKCLYFAV